LITAIFFPPRSVKRLTGASTVTRNPPPSTKIRLEKSTSFKRVCVIVVLAQSMSALPEATICSRSETEPTRQFTLRSGSPTARLIAAITRWHRSIE